MANFGFFIFLFLCTTFHLSKGSSFLCHTLRLTDYCPDEVDYTVDTDLFCIAEPTNHHKVKRSSSLPECSLDIVKFGSGRAVNGTTFRSPSELLPSWANITLAQEGQKFAQKNLLSVGLSAGYGLIAVLTIPDVKNVLTFTHLTDTPEVSTKRYIATAVQVLIWYEELLTKTDLNHNAWLTSITNVREKHRNAMVHVFKHGLTSYINNSKSARHLNAFWDAVHKDLESSQIPLEKRQWPEFYLKYESSTVPVNQFALALTQFAFIGYTILRPEQVYIWEGYDDAEGMHGLVHLWAIIGHALGIDDEYNVCLKSNMKEIKEYFQEIHDYYYIPALFEMDHGAEVLIDSLVEAMNNAIPLAKYFPNGVPRIGTLLFIRFLRDIYQMPISNQYKTLSKIDKLFDKTWDAFIPGTKLGPLRYIANKFGDEAMQLVINIYFGDYKTNMDKAKYIFAEDLYEE